ncbi:dTDP-4-dehydrorhamnose reductase [filamentous cyanobacterium CCT1]|nr:dTDP-4-dehydrorhamnose reductase [filamentous cyanobacterium CCT1]PSN81597.1 dTDP-4-dehydrorhamnose reductase [filamentous cyanobacterium CCP4]
MTQILLIGSTGQLGQELLQMLSPHYEVTASNRNQIDLTAPETIRDIITRQRPKVIINAAAYTAVDKAETEPDLAFAINATAPQIIAETAQRVGASFIHVSTDYVFSGQHHLPYQEIDPPQALGVYGRSKLAGENLVQQACDRAIILRTAWVYSAYGKGNFVKTMLRLGRDREELKVVMDQVGTPTWAQQISEVISQLLPMFNTPALDLEKMGVYNCTNSGVASWYDFAIAIFEEAQELGFPLKIKHVHPITTDEFPTLAQRPAYSVLSNQKLISILGASAPHWRSSLRQMLSQLYKNTYESTYPLRR